MGNKVVIEGRFSCWHFRIWSLKVRKLQSQAFLLWFERTWKLCYLGPWNAKESRRACRWQIQPNMLIKVWLNCHFWCCRTCHFCEQPHGKLWWPKSETPSTERHRVRALLVWNGKVIRRILSIHARNYPSILWSLWSMSHMMWLVFPVNWSKQWATTIRIPSKILASNRTFPSAISLTKWPQNMRTARTIDVVNSADIPIKDATWQMIRIATEALYSTSSKTTEIMMST